MQEANRDEFIKQIKHGSPRINRDAIAQEFEGVRDRASQTKTVEEFAEVVGVVCRSVVMKHLYLNLGGDPLSIPEIAGTFFYIDLCVKKLMPPSLDYYVEFSGKNGGELRFTPMSPFVCPNSSWDYLLRQAPSFSRP